MFSFNEQNKVNDMCSFVFLQKTPPKHEEYKVLLRQMIQLSMGDFFVKIQFSGGQAFTAWTVNNVSAVLKNSNGTHIRIIQEF